MYATPKECHIAIDARLQQLNSNRKLVLLPEEKDARLNEAVVQFIRNVTSDLSDVKKLGFEKTQKRLDDIEELIRTTTLPVYISGTDNVIAPTPWDYMMLANDRSIIKYNCTGIDYGTQISATDTVVVIPFTPDSTGTLGSYFNNFTISLTISGISTVVYTYPMTQLLNSNSNFMIIKDVLETLNVAGIYEAYWEYYLDRYEKNSFIIIVPPTVTTGSLNYNTTTTVNGTLKQYTWSTYNTSFDWSNTIKKSNELVSHANAYDLLANYYCARNRHLRPYSVMQRGFIKVYYDNTFVIQNVEIDYIKTPRLINYKLNQMCELSNMEEVVAIAVENIMADKTNDYKTFATERTIKE